MCLESYETAIAGGMCPEQARFLLPQGTEVSWYWTGSIAAFARFCKQRMDPHAQKEIQELAKEVSNIIEPLYPVSWTALVGE
jgi:thymidylate synthase (FAD)